MKIEDLVFKIGATVAIPCLIAAALAVFLSAPEWLMVILVSGCAIGACGMWAANLILIWRN